MKTWTKLLFCATALTALTGAPALSAELDETITFNIAPGALDEALIAYSEQADLQVISASRAVRGKQTDGVAGTATPREALAMLLKDSGLSYVASSPTTVTVEAPPGAALRSRPSSSPRKSARRTSRTCRSPSRRSARRRSKPRRSKVVSTC
jgi:hypothetical protein